MKLPAMFVLCAATATAFSATCCLAAEPSQQVEASVEIYELPQAKAAAWQKTFEDGPEPDRQKLVAQLRAGATEQAKTVGIGQRICLPGQSCTVATVVQYRYPTHFDTKDGFATATDFEATNVGCTMTLEVNASKEGRFFDAALDIRDVALLSTQHYAASRADQPGSITQPVFARQTITTRLQLVSGVPKLVGAYSPHNGDSASEVLRLIFVTICPDR